jgi:SulP family sulfate permease
MFTNIRGNAFGGITAGVVALPLALAFGVQSGLGAISGLYGAIAIGIIAALLGGTKTQISGPTGPMTVVAAAVVMAEIEAYGSLDAAFGTIVATFVLAGVFQILMGFAKVGGYIKYMPYPVISGFMSGIGAIIIILQIFPFFGMVSPKHIPDVFVELGSIAGSANMDAVGLALATLAIIYLFPRITKAIPSALVALIVLTVVSSMMGLNVSVIGAIPEGLPDLHLNHIHWDHPMSIVLPALTLAALGAIDSLLTSVVADNMTKTKHQSNKELIGQGIGNMAAGMIGGIPGAGATMRTVVNINAGGTTGLSGMIHGAVLLVILLGAGPYAAMIPLPVLAGILVSVGIGIIDYRGIKHTLAVPRADAVVMYVVLIMTVLVDLLQAVAVGMTLAAMLFMKKMGVITDSSTFAYLADIFILDNHRGKGLSKWLLKTMIAHDKLQNLRRIMLRTEDAHDLYKKFGFKTLDDADKFLVL